MDELKKVLFFSCEPGGAEVLIPVIKLLQAQSQYVVQIIAYGYAMDRFNTKQVLFEEIQPIGKEDFCIFEDYEPDIIITSATSIPASDMTEKYLWWQAKQKNIPSLAFLDQWQNYAIRFSGPGVEERLAYLPDYINCINSVGHKEMLSEGFMAENLVTFGHPYLSSLKHDVSKIDVQGLKDNFQLVNAGNVVLFVSEAIRENYGNARGYDQYKALDYFLSCISLNIESPQILIKLHPKDNRDYFSSFKSKFSEIQFQFIEDELNPLECLAIADVVFGMTSIMLIQGYILGKKIISLQPGLCLPDPMVLSRYKYIPSVISEDMCTWDESLGASRSSFDIEFNDKVFLLFLDRVLKECVSSENDMDNSLSVE